MSNKTFKIVNGDMSDGYHTFDELYDHRCLLFINLCLLQKEKARWREDYEAWFCLYLETDHGQISYHVPNKYKDLINGKIKRCEIEFEFDGHRSEDVINRLIAQAGIA